MLIEWLSERLRPEKFLIFLAVSSLSLMLNAHTATPKTTPAKTRVMSAHSLNALTKESPRSIAT